MAAKSVVNNFFRIYTAQKFIEGLFESQLSNNNMFLYIGKVTPWTTDSNPDQPNDTDLARAGLFSDMMAIKKVAPSDVSLVIPRHNWTSGTIYSQYIYNGAVNTGDSIRYDLWYPPTATQPFFVLSSDNNIYKCLNNNSGGVSSVQPTGKSTSPITTGDGYQWKFMYALNDTDVQKFLSTSWVPIRILTSNDGSDQWTVQQTAVETSSTPPGGHGSNAVYELGAFYVMVSTKYQYDEAGKVTISNDFRKLGLLMNPLKLNGTQRFTSLVGTVTTNLTVTGVSGTFNPDNVITGQTSAATGTIVDFLGGVLRLVNVTGTFVTSELVIDGTTAAQAAISTIALPDIKANSGQILYTEFRSAIARATDQIENFQIVVAF